MRIASVTHAEMIMLNKQNRFTVTFNSEGELEIILPKEGEKQELPFADYAESYPYSFNFDMKFKGKKIIITAKISKNFIEAYGKYAYLEALELMIKRAIRNIY